MWNPVFTARRPNEILALIIGRESILKAAFWARLTHHPAVSETEFGRLNQSRMARSDI